MTKNKFKMDLRLIRSMDEVLIRLKDIKKSFGDKRILHNINLNIHNGEIIGIIGKSGAGKTTLLKTIVGFLEPDKGDVLFELNKNQNKSHYRHFGFSTQEKSFYSRLTVKENLIYFASLHNLPKENLEKKIKKVLEKVQLSGEDNTIAKNLSQGMQKRLDIACAIIHNPSVLIVDEPTADLDPGLRKQIWSLIKSLNRKSEKTLIVSSHIPKELFSVCNKVFLLEDSKIKKVDRYE